MIGYKKSRYIIGTGRHWFSIIFLMLSVMFFLGSGFSGCSKAYKDSVKDSVKDEKVRPSESTVQNSTKIINEPVEKDNEPDEKTDTSKEENYTTKEEKDTSKEEKYTETESTTDVDLLWWDRYSSDNSFVYNTYNLRHGSDFEVEVSDGVFWVPSAVLGKSKYNHDDLKNIVKNTPKEKQGKISNLYEAIQLFQVSNFKSADDNRRIREGDINWEHHKPGYHAVRTNEGCCATSSNWLNYILKDDYDEIGFLAFSQSNGGGHVLNYIRENGYYYLIDLTHYRVDNKNTSPETGILSDYNNSDFVLGNIHRVKDIEKYVEYFIKNSNDPPKIFFAYTAENVLPIDSVNENGVIWITYPEGHDIKIIYDDPNDNVSFSVAEPPKKTFDWEQISTSDFEDSVTDFYEMILNEIINKVESQGPVILNTKTGHNYQIIMGRLSWIEAQYYCESLDGHLVTLNSKEEDDFVIEALNLDDTSNSLNFWIGATNMLTGVWRWVTNEPFTYTNWCEWCPDNYNNVEYWAQIRPNLNGQWNDDKKSSGFICEWEDSKVVQGITPEEIDYNYIIPGFEKQDARFIAKNSEQVQAIVKMTKTPVPNDPDKSYIRITADSDTAYWVPENGYDQWYYTFVFQEVNGVGLTIEEIKETYYREKSGGHFLRHDEDEIKEWWGDNYIPANGYKVLLGGSTKCSTKYTVWSIRGIDDNGNSVEFYYCMTMSQEPLSAHKDAIFKEVNEAKMGTAPVEGQPYVRIVADYNPAHIDTTTNSYYYKIVFEETNGIGINIEELHTVPYSDKGRGYFNIYKGEELEKVLGTVYLEPYSFVSFTGGSTNSQTAKELKHLVFILKGKDDNGNGVEFKYCLDFTTDEIPEKIYARENYNYDTHNLRYGADFEKRVTGGVYWVPVNTLGKSSYKNDEIAEMVNNSPETKASKIDTLYEALQLFQISNFKTANDNQKIREGDINWEHHKPGYHAVRTNEGCCATSSNWLNYILKDDYEEVGFIAFSESDGSGHVFNYIKHGGYYYFIDLTHYRLDFMRGTSVETGDVLDYVGSDRVAGNLHKTKSIDAYIAYYRSLANDPPEMFFMYTADNCHPVDGVYDKKDDSIFITYPENQGINVVFDIDGDNLFYRFTAPPQKQYDWNSLPSHVFHAILPEP